MHRYKNLFLITAIILLLFLTGCTNKKPDTEANIFEYESTSLPYQSRRDIHMWLEHFPHDTEETRMFDTININGADYDANMTLGEFINSGWVIEEYSRISEYKYHKKKDMSFDTDNSIEKSFKLLNFLNNTPEKAYRFLMRQADTNDIIYVIVSDDSNDKLQDMPICEYTYCWFMTGDDNDTFSVNGITKKMDTEEMDKKLLTDEKCYAKAEYADTGDKKLEKLYYTNTSAINGIRISYEYQKNVLSRKIISVNCLPA